MGGWLKIKEKRALIEKAAGCPAMTQHELAAWAKPTLKVKRAPAQTTVSDILKRASAIEGRLRRRQQTQAPACDVATTPWTWIQRLESQGICLSRALITMKARDIQRELCDAWELSFSDGWLTAFERRHGLRSRQRPGQAGSADPAAVALVHQQLQQLTDLYEAKDIFNMDETGLCYAVAPARSTCTKGACGINKNKTRITVALTSNADGTDALPPLCLGPAKQSYCFKKRTAEELGFQYRSNQKAWMTGVIFREWLLNLDRELRACGRHILLLLDNASSHSAGDLVFTNVRVKFLPLNTTAFIQPMDAGVIAAFKVAYRGRQLRWVYDKIKRGDKIDQLQAMQLSKEIWHELQEKATVQNCFRHTGIVFNAVEERSKDYGDTSYGADVEVEDIILRVSQISL